MMNDSLIWPMAASSILSLPQTLVWIAGIIFALLRWKKQPVTSLLTVISLALFLLSNVAGAALTIWAPLSIAEQAGSMGNVGMIFMAIGVVKALIQLIAWCLLLWALFNRRDERASI